MNLPAECPSPAESLPSRDNKSNGAKRPHNKSRPDGRKMGVFDPREQAAGGLRVSSEGVGVWAFKIVELRMQEGGKRERSKEKEKLNWS